ncbi:DinB family protein [Paenibacillus sp. P96]|uniref:DinB family protein n=1 Tax=Paenibacillus zeirhizosphaerae TaxID=2987519 RepID=A0ABT9FR20_9BACL|nr:DinB family protein [Paenibacillus sp. P96]MDP4097165.1 DinB family protein [Paenibacillus sp. P96]
MDMDVQANEKKPFFTNYINQVPTGNIIEILEAQIEETLAALQPLTEEQAKFKYAADKWSIKEVVGHLIDNERVWSYRLLRIARGDNLVYPGYEQDQFVREAQFDRIPYVDLLEEFKWIRKSTAFMLKGLPAEAWQRQGVLNQDSLTVNQAAYVIAGHEIHHQNILRERYLPEINN